MTEKLNDKENLQTLKISKSETALIIKKLLLWNDKNCIMIIDFLRLYLMHH